MKAGRQPEKLERGMVLVEPGSRRRYSINGFPAPGWVTLRNGDSNWSTPVTTCAAWMLAEDFPC